MELGNRRVPQYLLRLMAYKIQKEMRMPRKIIQLMNKIWEQLYNSNFKVVEFAHFKQEAGLHTFTLSVTDWVDNTNAVGIYVKRGRYGGTYAHKGIAFEFASAISPVFKLYLIKEFQRLKEEENDL